MTGAAASGGLLLVLAVMLPLVGLLALQVVGPALIRHVALAIVVCGTATAAALVFRVVKTGHPLRTVLGGWEPPLGLALRADGASAALIGVAAVVMACCSAYALRAFPAPPEEGGDRASLLFFSLAFSIWSALNAVAVGEDLFNLYVALELLTFAAVPLVALDGRRDTVSAALRYLTFALSGSMLYLLGCALLYGAAGTLDIHLLAAHFPPAPAARVALALMTAGLLAKAALVPLHLWLPPAHAGAPPAASAILSALVIKAPFFLLLRLWFEVAPPDMARAAAPLLGGLGALAVLHGSLMALRQSRLKLLIAYSTVAQLGYLFLVFPLAWGPGSIGPWTGPGWTAGLLQLAAHAFAKAAMFLAAGVVAGLYGHDRIAELGGFGRAAPVSALAFALGGLSLVGLPPSGGFTAKWLMLTAALQGGHGILAGVILLGGLLAAGYVFHVLGRAVAAPATDELAVKRAPLALELPALALALAAVALGLVAPEPFQWLQIGRGGSGGLP
jgi:formate hydrogenlyase subunit 3/multisubunit Na+/H+ antiporter MnhD subunit